MRTIVWPNNQKGVEIVELALTLPLVLFLVIGTLDIAKIVSAYSTVRSAAIMGTRQAVGRERDEFVAVDTAMNAMTGNSSVVTPTIAAFTGNDALTSPSVASLFTVQNLPYLFSCPEAGGPAPLTKIYRYEVRALTNANYLLSNSFPSAVYPCPPGDPRECFTCCVLRGNTERFTAIFSVPASPGVRLWSPSFVGIRCALNVPLTTSALTIGFTSPFINIAASSYSQVATYDSRDYSAQ